MQDSEFSADWFDAAMSKSDDHPYGPWQVPDLPRSANDLSGSATDRADTEMAGSRTAAAASDVDTAAQLWSNVRGRLLITAVTVSMLASIVVLVAWICLRSAANRRYETFLSL